MTYISQYFQPQGAARSAAPLILVTQMLFERNLLMGGGGDNKVYSNSQDVHLTNISNEVWVFSSGVKEGVKAGILTNFPSIVIL